MAEQKVGCGRGFDKLEVDALAIDVARLRGQPLLQLQVLLSPLEGGRGVLSGELDTFVALDLALFFQSTHMAVRLVRAAERGPVKTLPLVTLKLGHEAIRPLVQE